MGHGAFGRDVSLQNVVDNLLGVRSTCNIIISKRYHRDLLPSTRGGVILLPSMAMVKMHVPSLIPVLLMTPRDIIILT